MPYVYRHIRLDKNEPFYIGVGKASNNSRAYSDKNRNKYWHNVVKKTAYEVEILFDDLSPEEARIKEIEFIALYGRKDMKTGCLVNMTDGGDGCLNKIISKETAQKISESNKNTMSSPEYRKRMSEIHKKRYENPETYRKHIQRITGTKHKNERSLEHRMKISANNRKRVYSAETRKRMSDSRKGMDFTERVIKMNLKSKVAILQYDLEGNLIKEWDSIANAAKSLGKCSSNITKCCRGESEKAIGFVWKYKNPERLNKKINVATKNK